MSLWSALVRRLIGAAVLEIIADIEVEEVEEASEDEGTEVEHLGGTSAACYVPEWYEIDGARRNGRWIGFIDRCEPAPSTVLFASSPHDTTVTPSLERPDMTP